MLLLLLLLSVCITTHKIPRQFRFLQSIFKRFMFLQRLDDHSRRNVFVFLFLSRLKKLLSLKDDVEFSLLSRKYVTLIFDKCSFDYVLILIAWLYAEKKSIIQRNIQPSCHAKCCTFYYIFNLHSISRRNVSNSCHALSLKSEPRYIPHIRYHLEALLVSRQFVAKTYKTRETFESKFGLYKGTETNNVNE